MNGSHTLARGQPRHPNRGLHQHSRDIIAAVTSTRHAITTDPNQQHLRGPNLFPTMPRFSQRMIRPSGVHSLLSTSTCKSS